MEDMTCIGSETVMTLGSRPLLCFVFTVRKRVGETRGYRLLLSVPKSSFYFLKQLLLP